MTITIYGYSDDLIEIEGDIREEFTLLSDNNHGDLIALSNGDLFRVAYTDDGIWRIAPLAGDSGRWDVRRAVSADDDNYSDRVTVHADIEWVAHAVGFKAAI